MRRSLMNEFTSASAFFIFTPAVRSRSSISVTVPAVNAASVPLPIPSDRIDQKYPSPPGNTDMTSPHAPLFADAVNLPQLTLNFVLACIVTQSVSRSSDISGSLILTPSAFSAHRRISSPPTCIVRASIPESVQRIIRSPRTLTFGASSPISASAPFSRRLDAAS